MARSPKRRYDSSLRAEGAEATRKSVLSAARTLFSRRGIDRVTIAQIAESAGVAASTVFALYKSKEGLLRALMQGSLFGARFQAAQAVLEGITDPVVAVERTSGISRAIYESESDQVGLLRGASGFSVALRKLEDEFEERRLTMQEERLKKLAASGRMKRGITFDEARRITWMYTSRDVYRMLVHAGGWTPDRYQEWLGQALVSALVE